jgi:NAD(P)-dependent dehydrogenase (short-subunit alcohol dehydrogenase family)
MTSSKVAIVTGGSKGIGAEIALHLLAKNMRVVVAFLVSEEASYITGQNYTIDGGMTAKMIYI